MIICAKGCRRIHDYPGTYQSVSVVFNYWPKNGTKVILRYIMYLNDVWKLTNYQMIFCSLVMKYNCMVKVPNEFMQVALQIGQHWFLCIVWFSVSNFWGQKWWLSCILTITHFIMITSSNGNIFRITDHLCGEFTGHRWIPGTKTTVAELWCFL